VAVQADEPERCGSSTDDGVGLVGVDGENVAGLQRLLSVLEPQRAGTADDQTS